MPGCCLCASVKHSASHACQINAHTQGYLTKNLSTIVTHLKTLIGYCLFVFLFFVYSTFVLFHIFFFFIILTDINSIYLLLTKSTFSSWRYSYWSISSITIWIFPPGISSGHCRKSSNSKSPACPSIFFY